MSSVDDLPSLNSLERTKRLVLRSLAALKGQIDHAFSNNPSEDLTQQITALLDEARSSMRTLQAVTSQILDATDVTGLTPDLIARTEEKVGADYIKYQLSLADARGKLNSWIARLKPPVPISRQSLDASLIGDVAPSNPLVKLPDIPVPKFDGKIKNFTEWHSLFEAMIDANEKLKPVQKLYYLKQAMTGDAQNLLKDYALQDGLYDSAFKYVKERYFNKRVIISNHFRDILDLPPILLTSLRESLDRISASIRGLNVCDISTVQMSPFIAYIVVRKLPENLRMDWENSNLNYSTYPSYDLLENFLQKRCFSYESMRCEVDPKPNPTEKVKPKAKTSSLATTIRKPSCNNLIPFSRKCVLCGLEHYLSQCNEFLQKTVADRFALVKDKKLCTNCLRKGHSAAECNSSRCRKCSKNHNSLLHREISRNPSPEPKMTESSSNTNATDPKRTALAIISQKKCIILLPSAVANVQLGRCYVKARVLIDACSQVNLVSEMFVLKHRLRTRSSLSTISGVNPGDLDSTEIVSLCLKSRISNFSLDLDANVVGRIPYEVSHSTLRQIESLSVELPFADCGLRSSNVDILIGGEFANKLLSGNKRIVDDLVLEETPFGWIAAGPLEQNKQPDKHCCHLTVKVEEALAKFWEVEEVDSAKPKHSEHELCELHFVHTHSRLNDGRFQIRLPFKTSCDCLADTYQQARSALLRSEAKMDSFTRSMYVDFMEEYCQLGHMTPAVDSRVARFFIPHLPVFRPDSSTTKLRVVFNASAKNSTGNSLNESLMVGPTIQPDLFTILLTFRTYRVAFSGDVTKMYRQIAVHPDDRRFQSVLWCSSPDKPVTTFQLTTLAYGTTPASFLATKCLQQLAREVEQSHPDVTHAIASEFYMDDLLTGADSLEAAIRKRDAIHSTLASAHFPLRKYVSNSPEFLHSLDSSLVEALKPIGFTTTGTASILGLQWDPASDSFSLCVKLVDIDQMVLTKRIISSLAAQIFDPLGFAAPVVIRAKILLQDLWREGAQWDDPTSPELDKKFRKYYSELSALPCFRIPRYYASPVVELVGFSDASTSAYGAAIYTRTSLGLSILVCAKSKVAPLKTLTIPRLELLGAVLLTKLFVRVGKTLNYDLASAIAFCDSTVVLAWLKGPSSNYETFVRNRVDYVAEVLPYRHWRYVKTAENPADLLTRGIAVSALGNNRLWLSGPEWLSRPTLETFDYSLPDNPPERRKVCHVIAGESPYNESLIASYSDFDKLVRIITIMWNFAYQAKPSLNRFEESLALRTRSIYSLCRISQKTWFCSEMVALAEGIPLNRQSSLQSISPFLDSNGLLRVGGRLRNSLLPYASKHPIILPRRSRFTELLVRYYHECPRLNVQLHADRSSTLGRIQSRYWIHGGAHRLVKAVINRCVWCARIKGETLAQIMGDLPAERTVPSRPFSNVGVDLGGPFTVKCTNHRSMKYLKYYAAFFVCMVTRAVHIDVVSDLSATSFIATLQRFCARRGVPRVIWSDNATNFVGASNAIDQHCASLEIQWKRIPARSPHHGGIWEAAVKAAKKHLLSASKGSVCTAEQLTTLLAQVEALLNSRPLYRTNRTNNVDEVDVLTPGHFLVGSGLMEQPEPDLVSLSLSDHLTARQQVLRSFWSTWSRNYLTILQRRTKWKTSSPNVNPGDVVLLKDNNTPAFRWPLARIDRVYPDAKGIVRVVDVRHNGSTYSRCVQKVVRLPVN